MDIEHEVETYEDPELGLLTSHAFETTFEWNDETFRPRMAVVVMAEAGETVRVAVEFADSQNKRAEANLTPSSGDLIESAIRQLQNQARRELFSHQELFDRALAALAELEEEARDVLGNSDDP